MRDTIFKKLFLFMVGAAFFSCSALAQQVFTVRDQESQRPLEYAQVALLRLNQGTATDQAGQFRLLNYTMSDTILLSSLGYQPRKLVISFLLTHPVVYLHKQPLALGEVVVRAPHRKAKTVTHTLGWFASSLGERLHGDRFCVRRGSRIVVWLANPTGQPGDIRQLVIQLLPRQSQGTVEDGFLLVRGCCLDGNPVTGPEQDTSVSTAVYEVKPNSKVIHLSFADAPLPLPAAGGFVGLEWLGDTDTALPVCLALTRSTVTEDGKPSQTWQSYRGKKWGRFGSGYSGTGASKRAVLFSNGNARMEATVSFPVD